MLGTRLADRYEIVSELGRGGMGVVYRARDPRLNRDVAVKLIPPSQLSDESEQRFQREAQLVAQMDHPSIVPIYDFGRHDEALYFVMALVQGTNLRAFLRQDSQLGDVVDIGIQVAEALDYSHARGVVHRDIKPENIMVAREDGRGVRVRVMDFGLARAQSESRMTRTGTLMGTLGYLSPEQITGHGLDGRSDIYALGTVLYECVVGEPPFAGEAQAVVYRIVHEFPQAPRARGAVIDDALDAIIMDCLRKEAARRPQRAGDVAESLKRYRVGLHESDRSRPITELTRTLQSPKPTVMPFIGRERESAELQQRLNAAVSGESQIVLVGGEPGVGKTRLLDELESLAKARQIRVLHGRSVELDRGLPYQGFLEMILEYFRLRDTGSSPPPDLSDLAIDLASVFPMLSEVPEIRSAVGSGSSPDRRSTTTPENRTQIFELMARSLTRLAAGRPLVLFMEDLHAADITLDALEYIVRRLGSAPILIVGTYRTTDVTARHPLTRMIEDFQGERRAASIILGPLSPSEHRAFLETLVGHGIADGLVKRLYKGSEGNPFFTRELVRALVDSGGIVKDDSGAWNLSAEASLAAEALPPTIQKAVEKRIGRLPDDLRDVLSVASVIGTSFDARDLAALLQARDVDDAIDRLVEEGLIEEERESRGGFLSFSSGVVHDVLYTALSPRKRRSLHRRCAELLETRYAGRIERVLPQLVQHYFQGDVPDKTVEYALRLTKASLETFSVEDAVRSATTALTFLDADWEGSRVLEGDARLLLARATRMAGDLESAQREAAAASRVFEQEKDLRRLAGALLLAAETAWQARQPDAAAQWLEKGLSVARSGGDIEVLRQLLSLAITRSNLVGEHDRANTYLAEAAAIGTESQESTREDAIPSGGRLVVAQANQVHAIEPVATKIIEESEIGGTVYETLLATDSDGHLLPWLCEKWELVDQGRRALLTLRRDVHFSDGTLLTASGVKASIETSIRAAPTVPAAFAVIRGVSEFLSGSAGHVQGIVARDDHLVDIELAESLPIYPSLLTDGGTAIVRPLGASDTASPRLAGTGAFQLVSLESGRVVVERNPGYWRAGLPRLDAIEFRPSLSPASIARQLRSGEIDVARDLQPDDLEDILRDPRFRPGLVETPKKNTYFVLFNCRGGPQARSLALRRALSGVVRPRDLVWRTLGRFAAPAAGLIPPGLPGHDPGRRWPALSRSEALQILRSGGIEGPLRLTATVQPLLRDRAASLVKGLFAAWADLDIDVHADAVDMATFLDQWRENNAIDLLIGRWNADYDDPDTFTHSLFHSANGALRKYFTSPEADLILEEARAESRPAIRETLYRKFEGLLLESAALVPLFHDIDYRLASPRVRGLVLRGTKPYVNYSELGVAPAAEPVVETRRTGGGVVHIPMVGVITSLDTVERIVSETAEVLPFIFETLTRDRGEARIVPWLARQFRIEEGGLRHWFRLRDDVTFHDGRKPTARDVRYSLERLLQSGNVMGQELFASIRGAKALAAGETSALDGFRIHSATEFSIELDEPIGFLPALLSHPAASIVPEGSEPSSLVIGTGPFRVAAFESGHRLELERNRAYWRRGYPRSDRLTLSFGVAPKEIAMGFRQGRYALAWDLLPADAEELRRSPEFASGYKDTPRMVTYYVGFNTHRGVLTDKALRRRLARSVDVPRLVRQTLGRLATPAFTVIPPGLLGHDAASTTRLETPSPATSETVPASLELTMAVHPMFLGTYASFARDLSQAFASIGVTLRVVTSTMADFIEATDMGQVDLTMGRWTGDYPDPDTFATFMHSQRGFQGRMCGSAETDRLIQRGRVESSPAVRHALYLELEEIIARDAMVLPLFHEQAYRIGRPELEGLSVTMGTPCVPLEDLRLRADVVAGGRV
jgi:ABC-type transport system substrate-binding protein/serine/threonine protein kinase